MPAISVDPSAQPAAPRPYVLTAHICVLVVVLVVAFPITIARVHKLARDYLVMASNLQRNYSHAQGRPFEISSSFVARRTEARVRLDERATAIAREHGSLSGMRPLLETWRAESIASFQAPATDWKYQDYYAHYQAHAGMMLPFLWALERLNASEADVAVAVLMTLWIGVISLWGLTRRASGSWTAAWLAVAAAAWLHGLVPDPASRVRATICWTESRFLYTFAVLGASMLCSTPGGHRALREAAGVGALALLTVVGLFQPVVHRPESLAGALLVLACGAIRLERRGLLVGVLAIAAVGLALRPYRRFTEQLWRPVTPLNHAESEAMRSLTLVFGLSERPGREAIPPSDFMFTVPFEQDALVRAHAPALTVHHSAVHWGRERMRELVWQPLRVAGTLMARIFDQVVFAPELEFGLLAVKHGRLVRALWYLSVFLGAVVAVMMLLIPGGVAMWGPALALLAWNLFGLYTLFTIIHIHPGYFADGVAIAVCLLPAMLGWALRQSIAIRQSRPWQHPLARVFIPRTLMRRRIAVAIVAVVTMLGLRLAVRHARAERLACRAWLRVHAPLYDPDKFVTPDQLDEELRQLIAMRVHAPGLAEMHAAWITFAYRERLGWYRQVLGEAQKDAGHAWPSYKLALDQALAGYAYRAWTRSGREPHAAARMRHFGLSQWPTIFEMALEDDADHPDAVSLAYQLSHESILSPDRLRKWQHRFVESQAALLARTAWTRPGFEIIPALVTPPSRPPWHTRAGLAIRMAAGETVALRDVPLHASDRIKVGLRVEPVRGHALIRLAGAPGGRQLAVAPLRTDGLPDYYVLAAQTPALDGLAAVRVELQAAEDAELVIGDHYPMHENPRFFRDGRFVMRQAAQRRTVP
jgi:hypothetical protein